jgi:hypothetical protein
MLLVEPAKHVHCASDAISFAIDEGWTTATELRRLMRISDSTLSRWRNGETEPSFDTLSLVVRQHHDPRLRMLFPGVMSAGTPIVLAYSDCNLDVNGDGEVNLYDATSALSTVLKKASAKLESLITKVTAQKSRQRSLFPLSAAEALGYASELDSIMCDLTTTARVVDHVAAGGRK